MNEFTIRGTKQLKIDGIYNVTFAGKRYRARCVASQLREFKIRNAAGSLIPHANIASDFIVIREIEA